MHASRAVIRGEAVGDNMLHCPGHRSAGRSEGRHGCTLFRWCMSEMLERREETDTQQAKAEGCVATSLLPARFLHACKSVPTAAVSIPPRRSVGRVGMGCCFIGKARQSLASVEVVVVCRRVGGVSMLGCLFHGTLRCTAAAMLALSVCSPSHDSRRAIPCSISIIAAHYSRVGTADSVVLARPARFVSLTTLGSAGLAGLACLLEQASLRLARRLLLARRETFPRP